jgi:hypothetical protein
MWQVEPATQLMLPLLPTVTVHIAPLAQANEQDSPQLPVQVLLLVQLIEQLPPLQPPCERSQLAPAGQLQLDPVQVGACAEPQPAMVNRTAPQRGNSQDVYLVIFIGFSINKLSRYWHTGCYHLYASTFRLFCVRRLAARYSLMQR